jgi:DNA-directed RNA polymerase subunit RPC12/RpoP
MADYYQCFVCGKVYPLLIERDKQLAQGGTCASCGVRNGGTISQERFSEGFEAGAIYNFDPRTGKPAKKRRR